MRKRVDSKSLGSAESEERYRTSGLACSALTRSGEKLTGDSLIRCQTGFHVCEVIRVNGYLVKTC